MAAASRVTPTRPTAPPGAPARSVAAPAPAGCPPGGVRLLARPRRPGPGPGQRLRRQRRRRDHDLLARRRAVRLRAAVGDPGQPGRPVLHPGGRGAPRPRHRQGPDGPHPRALGRPLGRLRGAPDARREPRLDRRRVRRASARRSASSASRRRSAPRVAAVVVVGFIALGSYSRVQYLFVGVGIFVSVAYVISAFLAEPGLGAGASTASLVPQLSSSPVYWLAVVGTVGTTITPVGPGVHPVVRRRQGAPPGRPRRPAGSTSSSARC